jgi:hypothetical protein
MVQVTALADAQQAFDALSDDDKKRFVAEMEQRAGDTGRILIWVIVLIVMAGVIFFFGYLGYLRLAANKDGAVLFAFATTALGAIAGLLAPSPMSK